VLIVELNKSKNKNTYKKAILRTNWNLSFDKIISIFIYLCDRLFFSSHTMSNTLNNKVLINKLQNTLNELINRNDLGVKTTELSNELLETTKIIENCTSCCKDKKIDGNSLDEIENYLAELEKKEQKREKWVIIDELNQELFKINIRLNNEILCEGCKEKEIEKLTDKYGNEEIARLLHECKLNAGRYDDYIRWIPFDEFKNIKYLAKGGFGEVHKATWINGSCDWSKMKYEDQDVVLKRIYNNNSSDDKIVDILKEVKNKSLLLLLILKY